MTAFQEFALSNVKVLNAQLDDSDWIHKHSVSNNN